MRAHVLFNSYLHIFILYFIIGAFVWFSCILDYKYWLNWSKEMHNILFHCGC